MGEILKAAGGTFDNGLYFVTIKYINWYGMWVWNWPLENINFYNIFPLLSVVKTTILLTDMAHFTMVNEVYAKFFKQQEGFPARACYQVKFNFNF
jgi:hypothetical protein